MIERFQLMKDTNDAQRERHDTQTSKSGGREEKSVMDRGGGAAGRRGRSRRRGRRSEVKALECDGGDCERPDGERDGGIDFDRLVGLEVVSRQRRASRLGRPGRG